MDRQNLTLIGSLVLLAAVLILVAAQLPPLAQPPPAEEATSTIDLSNLCTALGCESALIVKLTGSIPSDFTVDAWGGSDVHKTAVCHRDGELIGGSQCSWGFLNSTLLIPLVYPAVTVTITWSGGSKTQIFHPSYNTYQPNGPGCGPICHAASVTMSLP